MAQRCYALEAERKRDDVALVMCLSAGFFSQATILKKFIFPVSFGPKIRKEVPNFTWKDALFKMTLHWVVAQKRFAYIREAALSNFFVRLT